MKTRKPIKRTTKPVAAVPDDFFDAFDEVDDFFGPDDDAIEPGVVEEIQVTLTINAKDRASSQLKPLLEMFLEEKHKDKDLKAWEQYVSNRCMEKLVGFSTPDLVAYLYGRCVLLDDEVKKPEGEARDEDFTAVRNALGEKPEIYPPVDTEKLEGFHKAADPTETVRAVDPILERSKLSNFKTNIPDKAAQVKALNEEAIINGGGSLPSPEKLRDHLTAVEKIKAAAADPIQQKWAIAESLATKPEAVWKPACESDPELHAMTAYISREIREKMGEVPVMPKDLMELYWPRMSFLENNLQANERRDGIAVRVMSFWNKMREKSPGDIDPGTNSYRPVVVAMRLERLIENYVKNYRSIGQENQIPDSELEDQIKNTALEYYKAHYPIERVTGKVGPKDMLDPDYFTYRMLCVKYNLKPGTMLHESNIY